MTAWKKDPKMKYFKLTWRRGIVVAFIVVLLTFFISNVGTVRAVWAGARALHVISRFEKEVLRTTRVGQYYEGLIFKHMPEASRLLFQDPQNTEKITALSDAALPSLEAYLNGKGDSAIITAEQMSLLKDILDDLSVTGSPSLQTDIQKEYERFPLERFVGMSMNEAYLYVMTHFTEQIPTPALVAGTDGKWAYYIHNGIYFEYPGNWYVQIMELDEQDRSNLIIIPASENPSQWDAEWVVIDVISNVSPESAFTNQFTFYFTEDEISWKRPLQVGDLSGFRYATGKQSYLSHCEGISAC